MKNNLHQDLPWRPTCWVGGILVTSNLIGDNWLNCSAQQLSELEDDSRAKYAATKATAAILRAMRK